MQIFEDLVYDKMLIIKRNGVHILLTLHYITREKK